METIINNQNAEKELHAVGEEIDRLLTEGSQVRVKVSKVNKGSLPMLRQWKGWMGVIGPWMASNGAYMPLCMKNGEPHGKRAFTADDAHELFSSTFMPVDEYGERYSWVLNSDSNKGRKAADIGMRLRCMDQMFEWALERGVSLPTREDSEYYKLKQSQEL